MEGNMKANGKTIIWMVLEYMSGMMEGSTKANIRMIKSMGLEYIHGQTEDAMKDTGIKESSME